jgi:hypothetical protein
MPLFRGGRYFASPSGVDHAEEPVEEHLEVR